MTDIQDGSNLGPLKQEIAETAGKIGKLKQDRQAINDDIKALRENMQAKGIKKEALDMAMKYVGWDVDKREGFDLAYSIVREALSLPFKAQGDLFQVAEKLKREKKAKKAADDVAKE